MTYAELEAATRRVAGLLRAHGVEAGDRVAIMLPNVPEFASAYYGALRLGAIVLPMNVLNKQREVAFVLREADARVIFALEGMHEHAEAAAEATGATCIRVTVGAFPEGDPPALDVLADAAPDDTAMLLFTSGTTGSPKGAELTHFNLARNAEISESMFGLSCEDVLLGALPLFHAFGQTCGLNTDGRRRRVRDAAAGFDPAQALELLDRHGVTLCRASPRCTRRCSTRRTASRPAGCATASPAAPRCPSACCARPRSCSAARCSRATASRRPRPSRRSTSPDSRARPTRSARRSRTRRCGSSTRTIATCRPASAARS